MKISDYDTLNHFFRFLYDLLKVRLTWTGYDIQVSGIHTSISFADFDGGIASIEIAQALIEHIPSSASNGRRVFILANQFVQY